jgi:hypothetical protein
MAVRQRGWPLLHDHMMVDLRWLLRICKPTVVVLQWSLYPDAVDALESECRGSGASRPPHAGAAPYTTNECGESSSETSPDDSMAAGKLEPGPSQPLSEEQTS